MVDHFVSNWMLPTGGFAITIAAGWFLTREYTERELVDGKEPGWFHYGAWRFFIQFVSPLAVAAIIIAVLFFRGGLQLADKPRNPPPGSRATRGGLARDLRVSPASCPGSPLARFWNDELG